MHNLHYIVVSARSHKEAVQFAESQIDDFGNENNWRTVFGAVDSKGKIVLTDTDARWNEQDLALDEIKKTIDELMNYKPDASTTKVLTKLKANKSLNPMEWYLVQRHAETMHEVSANKKPLDIWRDNFRYMELSEVGITNLVGNETPKNTMYICGLDMHS